MRQIFSKKNRALLSELVRTDFKLRYQGSVLGYAWSLLRPLLLFVILYFVFVKMLRFGKGIPYYPIYLLFGVVIWNFFHEMTTRSLTSIVERGDLIRKIKIPRWIIIFSSSLSALINFLLNLLVVGAFLVISHVQLSVSVAWAPVLFIELYVLALGLSFLLSALYVKYRDITYVWEVGLQAAFYLTPIIYPVSLITNLTFQKLMLLNPVAQIIQDARFAVVTHTGTITTSQVFNGGWYKLIPYILPVLILVIGILYFKKQSGSFAENV